MALGIENKDYSWEGAVGGVPPPHPAESAAEGGSAAKGFDRWHNLVSPQPRFIIQAADNQIISYIIARCLSAREIAKISNRISLV